jgi:hypothetical protein
MEICGGKLQRPDLPFLEALNFRIRKTIHHIRNPYMIERSVTDLLRKERDFFFPSPE